MLVRYDGGTDVPISVTLYLQRGYEPAVDGLPMRLPDPAPRIPL